MKLNRNLAVIALALLVASIWTYRAGSGGADRFERGRHLLAALNPDDVASIHLAKDGEEVTLERGEDGFTVTDVHGYPAANEAVNRVLRTLVDLELEKEVGTGDDLYRELGLTADSPEMTEVVLSDAAGAEMVRLRIGDAFEGGNGSYLRRLDGDGGPAYLSTRRVSFNTAPDSYLDKEIVNVPAEEIERIDGPDYQIARSEDGLHLDLTPPGRAEDPAKIRRVASLIGPLRFDEVFLADDDAVRGLDLEPTLDLRLADGSGYRLAFAERDRAGYIQVTGYHTVDRVTIDRDEAETELEEKAKILGRADEIAGFNRFHGSWVYRVGSSTADVLRFRRSDLLKSGD